MRPCLEILESRAAPSGITSPVFDVLALPGANPQPIATELSSLGLGPVASVATLPKSFGYSTAQIEQALQVGLFLDQGLYHGPNTIPIVVLPLGQNGPIDHPTTFHDAFSMLGGTVPFVGVSGNLSPANAAPGLRFDIARVQQGNFHTDNLTPGGDSPGAPNFLWGDLIFLWLAEQYAAAWTGGQ